MKIAEVQRVAFVRLRSRTGRQLCSRPDPQSSHRFPEAGGARRRRHCLAQDLASSYFPGRRTVSLMARSVS